MLLRLEERRYEDFRKPCGKTLEGQVNSRRWTYETVLDSSVKKYNLLVDSVFPFFSATVFRLESFCVDKIAVESACRNADFTRDFLL